MTPTKRREDDAMYLCMDCAQTFEHPAAHIETHGLPGPPYERIPCCPYCGGSFRETFPCSCCGAPVTGAYITLEDGGEILCSDCYTSRHI